MDAAPADAAAAAPGIAAGAGAGLVASDPLAVLRDPRTIRIRCAAITAAADDERSGWFRIDRSRLPEAAERVAAVTRRRFPDLVIPLHSRWRHFEAGGIDRRTELERLLAGRSDADRARACFDLTVISVLLDAGAGAQWSYVERADTLPATALPADRASRDDLMAALDRASAVPSPAPGTTTAAAEAPTPSTAAAPAGLRLTRSEGLGVASLRGFMAGAFSARMDEPCRVDAATLRLLDAAVLRGLFQAGPNNPLVGLEGRAHLLQRLGEVLQAAAAQDDGVARPSLIFDRITNRGQRSEVSAEQVLQVLLEVLSPIWTSGSRVMGIRAGDVWQHRFAGAAGPGGDDAVSRGWVPFHKLSQWLAYSLIEPLQWAGVTVTGVELLTGLPEYRNGGLLLDTGVLVPRARASGDRKWPVSDEFIVEWRALTVTLLDELAARVRVLLGAPDLALAQILEGGTWAAGREIAQERRGGTPPLAIDSDGTIF